MVYNGNGCNCAIKFPRNIEYIQNLNTLKLIKANIQIIPTVLVKLLNLTELILMNNKINKIPLGLWNLKNLIVLNLNCNMIEAPIVKDVEKLQDLVVLDLISNKIGNLINLEILNLTENLIEKILSEIGRNIIYKY